MRGVAGFWERLLGGYRGEASVFRPQVFYLGVDAQGGALLADPSNLTAAQMWRTQPHFRTVVSFMARNIAQLRMHSFERVDDSDRRRDHSSALAQALRSPDGSMTEFELKYALVVDLCLYDRAYWITAPTATGGGWMLRRLPPTWVTPKMRNPWEVERYEVRGEGGAVTSLPPESVLAFPGFHPGKASGSSPAVDALRSTLMEQLEAARYRQQIWKRGGRVSAVLQRPAGSPEWSDTARQQFADDWYAKFTGKGERAGGTPILEDGMTLNRIDFNAQEQQFVEAAKLSLVTVASAFHINPTMIGQNDGANYSNVREFRKMLYGDTLGPLIAQIESRINTFLIPRLGMDPATFYVEFNIEEKLQGNFEEQTASLQSATGAPWMTRNEARALRNLPAIDGGDSLVTPLNVLIGEQSSPRDSGAQNRNDGPANIKGRGPVLALPQAGAAVRVKAEPRDEDAFIAAEVLRKFFTRQASAVLSLLGAEAPAWWNAERWDRELADSLYAMAMTVTEQSGRDTMSLLDVDPDLYDPARTAKFLRSIAESRAGAINAKTRQQIEAALAGDLSDDAAKSTPAGVFEEAATTRAEQSGRTLATALTALAVIEAAKMLGRPDVTKTWVVNSSNPRPSHAAMNGETVGIEDTYSNGMQWPGDSSGGADEVANCSCTSEVTIP